MQFSAVSVVYVFTVAGEVQIDRQLLSVIMKESRR
jgi:uncharacterized protein with ATP-grasp and redox domains